MRDCTNCPYLDDIEKVKRNNQFDIIYCVKCKNSFERRMKPWNCPFSELVNKAKVLQPTSCSECPYADADFCNLTNKDMQVSTNTFKHECPLYNEEKMPK